MCSKLFCTFLCRCFARLQLETSRNFFYGGNVVGALVHFFFTAAHFFLTLVTATKFSCCSYIKKCLLCFLSLPLDLCRPFSR